MADDTDNTPSQNTDAGAASALKNDVASAETLPTELSSSRRNYTKLILLGLLIIALIIGVHYGWQLWQFYRTHESTDDAYVVGDITPISARIAGTVVAVLVKENQSVEAGQLLAHLDPGDFEARVRQAEAAVAIASARVRQAELQVAQEQDTSISDTDRTSATLRAARSALQETRHVTDEARARLRTLETAVAVAQAEVDAQDAHLSMARTGFERAQDLFADGVVAQQQFDDARSLLDAAQAERRAAAQKLTQAQREIESARADLRTKIQAVERARAQEAEAQALLAGSQAKGQNVVIQQAQVEVERALLKQKEADLAYAQLQLSYTALRAPATGVVARKNLEVGQVIQVGRPVLAIVPQQDVWVVANFKETQLHRMRPGQSVTLKVDAYPGEKFKGTVESLSPGTGSIFSLLPPENATGNFVKVVQRVPVKIVLEKTASESVLRRGMSVVATVAMQE
ncbi:MAG: HlyD family secretion protein [Candidatus Tectomicrobia bacterium]|nr:HlyD family secretion protein [Candidatus Tectomicrobia bacterium]